MTEEPGTRCPSPPANAGITEELIERQVRAFYGKVRRDPVLGPIFAAVVKDWEPHLLRMCAFWSSVLLTSGRYKGNPVAKHAPLTLHPAHFARWLRLFAETANETCPPDVAALFATKAELIAQSLQLAAAVARGELPHPVRRTGAHARA